MKLNKYCSEDRLKNIIARSIVLESLDPKLVNSIKEYCTGLIDFETFLDKIRYHYYILKSKINIPFYNKSETDLEPYTLLIYIISEYLDRQSFRKLLDVDTNLSALTQLELTEQCFEIFRLLVNTYLTGSFVTAEQLSTYFGCTPSNVYHFLRHIKEQLDLNGSNLRLYLVRGKGYSLIDLNNTKNELLDLEN